MVYQVSLMNLEHSCRPEHFSQEETIPEGGTFLR